MSLFKRNLSFSNVKKKLSTGIGIPLDSTNSLLNYVPLSFLVYYVSIQFQEQIEHWDWNPFGFP